MSTFLELQKVSKNFPIATGGFFRKKYKILTAVDGISLFMAEGTCFGIAGESGSGKTTLAKLILLMERIDKGSIFFKGKDIQSFNKRDVFWYRTQVQTIFQNAASSLNPRMRIRRIVSEPLEVQPVKPSRIMIQDKTEEMIYLVGLSQATLNMYPHELSGGQKQRVAIARAIVLEPSLVILDEPVSALDVSIRAQILNLLADIQEKRNLTYLIIAHDLAMLKHVTNYIAVMYLGKIMEMGITDKIFSNPLHPYTRALFSAVPRPEPGRVKKAPALSGEIGSPLDIPRGCRFRPRCNKADSKCRNFEVPLKEVDSNHFVACLQAYADSAIGN